MTVGRSALGVFATNGLNLVLSLGSSVLLTRTLGVVGRGEFAVFSASFGILSLVLGFGLDVSVRYFVAKGRLGPDRVLTSALVLAGAAGAAVFLVARLNHLVFDNELLLPTSRQGLVEDALLAGVVATNLVFAALSSVFAGARAFRRFNQVTVGVAVLSLAVWAALLWIREAGLAPVDAGHVFAAYLGLQVVAAGALVVVGHRVLGVGLSRQMIEPAVLREMLRYAGAAYGANVAQFLNYRVDVWIVQALVGSAALGLYALAAGLAMMLWLLPRSVSTVLLPAMAAGDRGADFEGAARLARLVFGATVLVGAVLAATAPWWIDLLYGAEFVPAARAFTVLLVGCVPFTLSVVLASALAAVDRVGVNLAGSVAGLVVTVALDFALIPRYGMMGAAWASAASYLVTTVWVVGAFSRVSGLPVRSCLVPGPGDLAWVRAGLRETAP